MDPAPHDATKPLVQAPTGTTDQPMVAVLLLFAAMTFIPIMDGFAKYLSASYPVSQVVWARYFFHLMVLLPLVLWRHGTRGFLPERPGLQLLRSSLMLISTILFFAAIAVIPLADAIALVFVSPLVVTACSPLVLGEKVGPRRWTAVIVGFVGALIIIRPGLGIVQWGSLLAVIAGTTYAFFILTTRKLSGSAPPLVTLLHTALIGAVAMSAVMPFVWVAPTTFDLVLMVAMGLFAAAGHFLIIKAFERAPASLLAPYSYSEIITATLIGYVVFDNFPDAWTWIGVAIIIASGIYIALRERHRLHDPPVPVAGDSASPVAQARPGPERRGRGG